MWLNNPLHAMNELIDEIIRLDLFKPDIMEVDVHTRVLTENERNRCIFLLLEGRVELFKSEGERGMIPVTSIRPGGMFGVMSFFSGQKALTTAISDEPSRIFRMNREEVDLLLNSNSSVSGMGRQLLVANLMERYSQVVDLNVQLRTLNHRLDEERLRLDEALIELRAAHERLVHQEKMASLGQLIAGVAHEINNPASAMSNAVSYLEAALPNLFGVTSEAKSFKSRFVKDDRPALHRYFFEEGLKSGQLSTLEDRKIRFELEEGFPELRASEIRKLSQLSSAARKRALQVQMEEGTDELQYCLKFAEAGGYLRNIHISSGRIAALVTSLKRYSRQESSDTTTADITEGIRDTLQILGNRLKQIDLQIDIPENLPLAEANGAEMNQVWTNILVNACDVLKDAGSIYISVIVNEPHLVVRIGDSGPGVPEHLREEIFKPHYTTRNSSGNFGLGLGLSISLELVKKNGGEIRVRDGVLGGAEFEVVLPLKKET